ncbi:FkbM family methyltransferase [Algoriphagus sp.]|uniref:FkbM family methyltransferase n=1 Tax=Algoriphagus sp. TaxID=1872435 RepID=UPI00261E14CF|nr:FkbM family methyltransferase [Algoriphagus sp.]
MTLKSKFKTFYKNLRISLSANENPLFMAYYRHFYKPKSGSLSAFLSAYSKSKKDNFTVIQIGANDGITNDPIHKFIKRDRWKGVLLEPQPAVYHQFLKKIYRKNKGLHPICAAIGKEDGQQKLFKIGFSEMRWATGLASFSKEKIEELFENGIVKKNCEKFGIKIPSEPSERIGFELVDVISPKMLMKKYAIDKIDLLQIDAEGFDLEVISIFDIPNSKPGAIIFEKVSYSPEELSKCYQMLNEQGYWLKEIGRDTLAMLNPSPEFEPFFQKSI